MNNEFINTGVFIAHEGRNYVEPRAICVCGVARSGTTSVASGLEAAGIPMGGNLSNVKEDQNFRRSIQSDNPKKLFDEYLRRRLDDPNRANDLPIGFKFPDAYKSIEHISNTQGLCILATMRDPLAIAIRNTESVFQPFDVSLDQAIKGARNLYEKVQTARKGQCKARIVFTSYEKILTTPHRTFEAIFTSSGLKPDVAIRLAKEASSAITNEPSEYRTESNLQPRYGIDINKLHGVISGWCYFQSSPNTHVKLQIRQDGVVIGECECNLPRPEFDGRRCGFRIDLNELTSVTAAENRIKIHIGQSTFQLDINCSKN